MHCVQLADPEENRRLWVSERRVGGVMSEAAAKVDAPWANKDSRKLIAEVSVRPKHSHYKSDSFTDLLLSRSSITRLFVPFALRFWNVHTS
jgi:hypothetical protein